MEKVKSIAAKVLSVWAAIGVAVITFGATGIVNIPESIMTLFSPETAELFNVMINAIVTAIGAAVTFAQAVRLAFLAKPEDPNAVVKTASSKDVKAFIWNPFHTL